MPIAPYKPGVPPPPHLSPFVDNSKEGYVPSRQKEINQLKGEEVDDDMVDEESEKSSEEEEQKQPEKPVVVKGDADSSSEEEDSEEENLKLKKVKSQKIKKELKKE